MKKLLVVLLALVLVFAFTACNEQAEEPAAGESRVVTLEDGLPTFTLGPDAASVEITDELASYGITELYTNAEENSDLIVYRFTDAAGMTAEEFAADFSEKVSGCSDPHPFSEEDPTPCWQVVFFTEDAHTIIDMWIMDGAEYPVAYGFAKHTEETRLEGTPLYMWLPRDYSAEALTKEDKAANIVACYKDNSGYLADITIYSWSADEWTYEFEQAACKANGVELVISEEDFNAMLADGVTLDDIGAYYTAQGANVINNDNLDFNGLPIKVVEIQDEYDGVAYNCLSISYLIDGRFYELWLAEPVTEWPCVGKAFIHAIHMK